MTLQVEKNRTKKLNQLRLFDPFIILYATFGHIASLDGDWLLTLEVPQLRCDDEEVVAQLLEVRLVDCGTAWAGSHWCCCARRGLCLSRLLCKAALVLLFLDHPREAPLLIFLQTVKLLLRIFKDGTVSFRPCIQVFVNLVLLLLVEAPS